MSVFWLSHHTTVMQNVTTGENWPKCTRDFSVLFLVTPYKSTIISIFKHWTKIFSGITEALLKMTQNSGVIKENTDMFNYIKIQMYMATNIIKVKKQRQITKTYTIISKIKE